MSQIPPQTEAAQPDATPKKSGGMLRIVLILIMLVMLGLLGWDQYARAASKTSFDKVVKWVEEDVTKYTPADVQQLLSRQPDRGLEDNEDYALETYSWPRGILVKSYFVKVIYRKDGDKVLLHEVVHNVEPEANDLPNPPAPAVTPATTGEGEPIEGSGEEPPTTTDDPPAEAPAAPEDTTSDELKVE
jgi:hypothetical protein